MPSDKYDLIGHVKAVEREHTALRFTTDHVLKSLDELSLGRHPKSARHCLVVPHGRCLESPAEIEIASPDLQLLQYRVVLESEGWDLAPRRL